MKFLVFSLFSGLFLFSFLGCLSNRDEPNILLQKTPEVLTEVEPPIVTPPVAPAEIELTLEEKITEIFENLKKVEKLLTQAGNLGLESTFTSPVETTLEKLTPLLPPINETLEKLTPILPPILKEVISSIETAEMFTEDTVNEAPVIVEAKKAEKLLEEAKILLEKVIKAIESIDGSNKK